MKLIFTLLSFPLFLTSLSAQQLGIYEFTGTGACPNQNPNITAQPSGATFSAFSSTGTVCTVTNNVYNATGWDPVNPFNPDKYYEFSITAGSGKVLNLDSLNFAARISSNTANWQVRSSLDNYANTLFSGANTNILDTFRNEFPMTFSGISMVTFRFYVSGVTDDQRAWRIDDVTIKGTVTSGGASIAELASADFSVFPNPGTDELNIMTKSASDLNIRIFTTKGKLVTDEQITSGQHTINTSKLESGLYLIELNGSNGRSVQRWVKQ